MPDASSGSEMQPDGGQTAQSTDDTERIDCDWCSAKFESKFRYICGLRAGIHVLWNHQKEVREWDPQRSTDSENERSKTPTHPCVYCGAECTFIGDHHREEHPSKRYDPVWYIDDVEADEGPIA